MTESDWIGQWRRLHSELTNAEWPVRARKLLNWRAHLLAELGSLPASRDLVAALEQGKQVADATRSQWTRLSDADRDSLAAMITEQQRLSAIANYS